MNILDMEPDAFEGALKEMGLEPEREQFLRDEYAKKNTVSGQMLGAFQEATAPAEGMERASVLPMIKPKGMSGIEAIRTGKAELALPGLLTGAVEEPLRAMTTGEKMVSGIATTPEEKWQAAQMGAAMGTLGAGTRLGKPIDTSVVSSGGAGPAKSYKPNLFSAGEVQVKPSPYSVTEFYSPTVEAIRNAEFPSKGYKGSELLKLLQDKTPGVRKAELNAMDLGLDPQKRYTKDEVLELADRRSYKVTSEVVDNDVYQSKQRQDIRDTEVDYATLKINATPKSDEVAAFLPKMGYTHYDPETIAHTRVSLRQDKDGSEYLLVEEIQSDLLQHKAVKPRDAITVDQAYDEVLADLSENLSQDSNFGPLYSSHKEFFDNYYKLSAETSRYTAKKQAGAIIPEEELAALEDLTQRTRDLFAKAEDEGAVTPAFVSLYQKMENAGFEEGPRIENRARKIGPSPLTEDSDAVRLSLQTAMSKAAESDVTSLVIPNVERIIAADRARPGSPEFSKYLEPGSGFQRTYTKGVEKFIKQLQSEYGEAVKIDIIELPYTKEKHYYEGKEFQLPNTALRIDFSGIKDVDFRVSRFAEGGMVEDEEMNRLMAEGGITDDGMNIEPVTGNEVPPGSLASEVRDDIPAKLSEGEYVVPADVVRYFGVRFFEDLRSQAKQGLAQMDADGRIGGATVNANGVPMGQEEELTPEEEQMLMEALGSGMYKGGVVGMAEGGFSQRDPAFGAKTFDRTGFSMPKAGGIETRVYFNPSTKEKKNIQFIGGNPVGAIPAGFVPYTEGMENQAPTTPVATTVAPTTTPTPSQSNSGGSGAPAAPSKTGQGQGAGFNYDSWAEKNKEAITSNPYQFGLDALADTSGKGLSMGLGVAGIATGNPIPLLGAGVSKGYNAGQNIAEARAALQVMESQGKVDSPEYKSLERQINKAISDLPGVVQLAVKNDFAATGDNYFKALTKTPTTTNPTTTPVKPATTAVTTSPSTSGKASSSASDYKAGTVKPSTGGPARTPVNNKPAPSTSKPTVSASTPKKESIAQKQKRGGGFKDGGLVGPKRKGLASK